MPYLQDVIHKLEVGGGMRYVRIALGALAVLLLLFGYNFRAFRNMSTQEAMDSAQVAHNLARGEGFSTRFVRPLSVYLVKKHNLETMAKTAENPFPDYAQLKDHHPDLANPPAYPLVLAGLMKVLPFDHSTQLNSSFWNPGGQFMRYQPDFLISLFNQMLLLVVIVMVFFLALRLFDASVAWVSAVLMLAAEIFWRFSVSGLSTIFALFLFVSLAWLLVLLEEEAREPKRGPRWLLVLAAGAGLVLGLVGLTRYALIVLVVPVLLYIVLYGGRQRVLAAIVALVVFAAVMSPWIARNYQVSGTWFGVAPYSILETTPDFREFRLQRSLAPDMSAFFRDLTRFVPHKFLVNARDIVTDELPRLGGSWVTSFFLVGLIVSLMNPASRRLRHFILVSLGVLIIAEAVAHTELSVVSPEINSENLLVLLLPFVIMYGVALFFMLLEQVNLPLIEMRYMAIGLFVLLTSLPMVFVFLPPRPFPVAYPPYDPHSIQAICKWISPGKRPNANNVDEARLTLPSDELMMSDVPWAIAWYGDRQCVWNTLFLVPDIQDKQRGEDFFAINDYLKPVKAIYLTPLTIDRRFISEWFKAGEYSWGSFILQCFVEKRVPPVFPLGHAAQLPFAPGQGPTPKEVEQKLNILDRQVGDLSSVGRKLLEDPKLEPVLKEAPETAALLKNVISLSEGREFPLSSAPVLNMKNLEQIILRGQFVLTDRPRWAEQTPPAKPGAAPPKEAAK